MKLYLVASVMTIAATAFAEDLTPAQEEAKALFDEKTSEAVEQLNESCGTKATVSCDFTYFKPDVWARGTQPYDQCELVLQTIDRMCKDRPAYKKALGKSLATVRCVFTGVKPKQKKDGSADHVLRNMSFAHGVFTLRMTPELTNVEEGTQKTVERSLNKKAR